MATNPNWIKLVNEKDLEDKIKDLATKEDIQKIIALAN